MTDVGASPDATRVILVGMMGSGKSTVGRALSARTGWPFVDNDALVERATGRTARQLLAQAGEEAMRQAEADAMRAGLALDPPVIVAIAAGAVIDAEDRARIDAAGFVVWLRAPADVLASRSEGAPHRPWLEDDPVEWFRRTLRERSPLYSALADLEIDAETTSPPASAEAIAAALSARR